MGIKIKITEDEIIDKPNDAELGAYIRRKYMEKVGEEKELNNNWFFELTNGLEPDACFSCGKLSPYTKLTHIDSRVGFVEGVGQGCFEPEKCLKKKIK